MAEWGRAGPGVLSRWSPGFSGNRSNRRHADARVRQFLGEGFRRRCEEEGIPDLMEMIADEGVTTTMEGLMEFLQRMNHPSLTMNRLM